MTNYKATLFVGTKEIDYMVFESKDFATAGEYVDARFDTAYPQFANREDAKIDIVELQA